MQQPAAVCEVENNHFRALLENPRFWEFVGYRPRIDSRIPATCEKRLTPAFREVVLHTFLEAARLRRDGTQAEVRMYVQSWGKNNPRRYCSLSFPRPTAPSNDSSGAGEKQKKD